MNSCGYPLGSPELRQHVHQVVETALWVPPIHEGMLRHTGFAIPTWVADLAPDEYWKAAGLL